MARQEVFKRFAKQRKISREAQKFGEIGKRANRICLTRLVSVYERAPVRIRANCSAALLKNSAPRITA
jgi:hypothetical protein